MEGNEGLMTKIRPATVHWEDKCTVLREMARRGSCQRPKDTLQAGKVRPKHTCLAWLHPLPVVAGGGDQGSE